MNDSLKDDCFRCTARNTTYPKLADENYKESRFQLWLRDGIVVKEIKKYLNQLETTVILMEVDYVDILGHLYQGNKNNRIFEQCYDIYESLESFVDELKNMRLNLDKSYNCYNLVEKFESFSLRFASVTSKICSEINDHEFMQD